VIDPVPSFWREAWSTPTGLVRASPPRSDWAFFPGSVALSRPGRFVAYVFAFRSLFFRDGRDFFLRLSAVLRGVVDICAQPDLFFSSHRRNLESERPHLFSWEFHFDASTVRFRRCRSSSSGAPPTNYPFSHPTECAGLSGPFQGGRPGKPPPCNIVRPGFKDQCLSPPSSYHFPIHRWLKFWLST